MTLVAVYPARASEEGLPGEIPQWRFLAQHLYQRPASVLTFFNLFANNTADVSICEAEKDSAILAEPDRFCVLILYYYLHALNLNALRCPQEDRSPGWDDFVLFDELSETSATYHGARHICRDNPPPNCSGGAATFVSWYLTAVVFLASILREYPVRIIHTFLV